MIYGILQRVVRVLAYEEEDSILYRAHAGVKVLSLVILWILLLYYNSVLLVSSMMLYVLYLHIIAPKWLSRHAAITASIPAVSILIAAALLSPYKPLTNAWLERILILTLRVYGLASATLITFATTNPLRLAILVRGSPILHDLLTLFYRTSPQVIEDLAEALAAQRLLGKPVYHTLVPVTLTSLRRAEGIAVSLQSRGYRASRRTIIGSLGSIRDAIPLVTVLTFSVIASIIINLI
ncbi:MAG: hypothetical protein GSR86_06535 [Desulfurococcales archaeon]|nr:hypothetical protein [Desulfurococcales archaeon]